MTDHLPDRFDTRPLVLVTVGSDPRPFDRLINWIDDYAQRRPDVRLVVQHGSTRRPAAAENTAYLDREALAAMIAEATAVVTHGGPATIAQARRLGRLPLVVARDPELGEHADDHQLHFVARLDEAGLVRSCDSSQQLATTLDKAVAQPDDFRICEDSDGRAGASALRAGEPVGLLFDAWRPAPRPLPVPAPSPAAWPDVTVVVPTGGGSRLLRETLRAITMQDYPGTIVTLVVYDRAEPDHSLADHCGDRPVLVLPNTAAPGLAGARNTGISAARTDLVAFCGDSDIWFPHKLRAQVEVACAEPGTDVVCSGVRVVHGSRETERTLKHTSITFTDLLRSRLTEPHPSTLLIRRTALVHGCGLVSEDIPGDYGQDYELLLRLARYAPVRNIPEAGARVLWRPLPNLTGHWRTVSAALRQLLEQYPEFRLDPRGYARMAGRIAFAEAAAGRRGAAVEWSLTALRSRLLEPHGYLALAVVCGLPVEMVLRVLRRRAAAI